MGGLRIQEASDADALRALAPEWDALRGAGFSPPVYMHPDHLRLWLEEFQPEADVRAVTAWSGDRLVGYAPFMVVPQPLGPFQGSSLRFIGNNIGPAGDLAYLDVWSLGGDPAIVDAILARARARCRTSAWDLGFLPQGSSTAEAARRLLGLPDLRRNPGESKPFLFLDLPETWDAYLARLSPHSRQNFRNRYRHLEALGKVEVRTHREAEACVHVVREMIQNHERWWSGTEREAWFGDRSVKHFLVAAARRLAERGEYLAVTLELGGKPIVWHAGALSGRVHCAELLSQDWAFSERSPGTVLCFAMIRNLIELGVKRFDLGAGVDQRKTAIGGIPREYARIRAYLGMWRTAERLHARWRSIRASQQNVAAGAPGTRSR